MNGQELSRLGTASEAARACIPLHMECTPPRIYFHRGWRAEYWYYPVNRERMEAGEPAFAMRFEIPSGKPVYMERLTAHPRPIGGCEELFEDGRYLIVNDYLTRAALMTECEPDEAQINNLFISWLVSVPYSLGRWFVTGPFADCEALKDMKQEGEEQEGEEQDGEKPDDVKPDDVKPDGGQTLRRAEAPEAKPQADGKSEPQAKEEPKDMVCYYKLQMAEAIRRGDDDAARRAREEMNRAKAKR